FLGIKKGALRQNDFGGTFGGPLYLPRFGEGGRSVLDGKDRTFFFFNYEGLRLVQPHEATINFVPNAAMIAATPSPLKEVLKAFPAANGLDVGNGVAQFISAWSDPSSLNSTSARVDHVLNKKTRL